MTFATCTRLSRIAGWTVTYIIQRRGGGPSAGYISSGFFGGKSTPYRWMQDSNLMFGLRTNNCKGRLTLGKPQSKSDKLLIVHFRT